jgi:hypothetical protein
MCSSSHSGTPTLAISPFNTLSATWVENGVVEDELHHFEQVVAEDVEVGPANRRETGIGDRQGLTALILRQRHQLDVLHLVDDLREPLGVARMWHDPEHRRDEVAGGLEIPVDALDLLTVVTGGSGGVDEHLLGVREVAVTGRHRHVHIVVVGGDHQRDIVRVERWEIEDHRLGTQVEHAADVQGVVVRPRDIAHRVVLEHGVRINRIPATLLEGELVVDVVHGDVLVRPPDDVVDLGVGQAARRGGRLGLRAARGREHDQYQDERNSDSSFPHRDLQKLRFTIGHRGIATTGGGVQVRSSTAASGPWRRSTLEKGPSSAGSQFACRTLSGGSL